jgi:hypothetical protein
MTEASAPNLVEYACSNQVATPTLNRPDRLNAFTDELGARMRCGVSTTRRRRSRSSAGVAAPSRAEPTCISADCARRH